MDVTKDKRSEAASEERFRTLLEFSFDVYWETDAQHRFTRQEFSEGLADAPAPGSEIGKTRWEVPYLEPDEEGGGSTGRRSTPTFPSVTSSSRARLLMAASATCLFRDCPCSTKRGASSATVASAGTLPTGGVRSRPCGKARPISPKRSG
jgi:hypothetical protein